MGKTKEERFSEAVSEVNRRWGFYVGQDAEAAETSEAKPKIKSEEELHEELLSEVAAKRYARKARQQPLIMPWEKKAVDDAISERIRRVNRKWGIGR